MINYVNYFHTTGLFDLVFQSLPKKYLYFIRLPRIIVKLEQVSYQQCFNIFFIASEKSK